MSCDMIMYIMIIKKLMIIKIIKLIKKIMIILREDNNNFINCRDIANQK